MNPASSPVAIVTGAADGIGWATALALARDGYCVALLDMRAEAVQARAASLGAVHLGLACDVTTRQQWPRLWLQCRPDLDGSTCW